MPRPNILLIHCHDLGRQLGCYGAQTVATPHLDALASAGVLAENMFTPAPQCSPSRAALFTGRWPHSTGVLGLTHSPFDWGLRPGERHLARRLHDAGYRTELIGVHHESRRRPDPEIAAELGFDLVTTGGLCTEVAARASAALEARAGHQQPFYLQVGFIEPHRIRGARDAPGIQGFLGDHLEPDRSRGTQVPPYLVDSESAREEIAELQGAIAAVDSAVGGILATLEQSGLDADTIVIFTTDHGLALPRAKCSLYDPGIETTLMLRWPAGGWTGGRRITELLSNVDVVPTLLDVLGPADVSTAESPPTHGRSFLPILTGRPQHLPVREAIFGELTYHDYYDPRRYIRTEKYKLIVNFTNAPVFMDPSQSWTPRCTPVGMPNGNAETHPVVEMYDLRHDPLEFTNVAEQVPYSVERDRLLDELRTWMVQTDDPLLDGAVTSPLHGTALTALTPMNVGSR